MEQIFEECMEGQGRRMVSGSVRPSKRALVSIEYTKDRNTIAMWTYLSSSSFWRAVYSTSSGSRICVGLSKAKSSRSDMLLLQR